MLLLTDVCKAQKSTFFIFVEKTLDKSMMLNQNLLTDNLKEVNIQESIGGLNENPSNKETKWAKFTQEMYKKNKSIQQSL